MKNGFTVIEMIFVIVLLGVLAAVAAPKYLAMKESSHEAILISFVRTLNRTTGEDLWARSISEGKNGSIKSYRSIKKYIEIPKEINATDINMENCGDGIYRPIAYSNGELLNNRYVISCKDGTETTAPYFKLIRTNDNKTLVNRE